MKQVLDLHLHSKYSRACSSLLNLENIAQTCVIKGIDIVSTVDFTHPLWFKEIEEKLEEISKTGLYRLKNVNNKTKFILGTEISLVYKDNNKTRRLHLLVHAPNLDAVRRLNNKLSNNFNLRADGRPILGLSASDFCKLCFDISADFIIYPAHIWTPWYSVLGSKSGFNSFEECFKEYNNFIYVFETGLSSDPVMNSAVPFLKNLSLLSSSDAHSLENIGREATVFEFETEKDISYQTIYQIIKNNSLEGNKNYKHSTIEFCPEEGTYYLDGHRDCNFSCLPVISHSLNNICPCCHKPLTIGVLNRSLELSIKNIKDSQRSRYNFVKIVELDKLIAEVIGIKNRKAVKVRKLYNEMIDKHGSELSILLYLDLKKISNKSLAKSIKRLREEKFIINPGFDGQYGKISLIKK